MQGDVEVMAVLTATGRSVCRRRRRRHRGSLRCSCIAFCDPVLAGTFGQPFDTGLYPPGRRASFCDSVPAEILTSLFTGLDRLVLFRSQCRREAENA